MQQREILRQVDALEGLDPTRDPAVSRLINGRLSLLYTGELVCAALLRHSLHHDFYTFPSACSNCGHSWGKPVHAHRLSMVPPGPGSADDTDWEQRTGGVEGPVLAALRPLSANAVSSKVRHDFMLLLQQHLVACMHVSGIIPASHACRWRWLARKHVVPPAGHHAGD